MRKFIELTSFKSGCKIFIAVDKIVGLVPYDDYTHIAILLTKKGSSGYDVSEGYEQIKCMLNGVFEGVD